MNGTYGPAAEKAREFVAVLKSALAIPVKTWDERLTSVQANRVLIETGMRREKRKEKSGPDRGGHFAAKLSGQPQPVKFKLTIAYDGTGYAGWQVQKTGVGVQQRVEEAIAKIFPGATRLHSSSRTDAGVHALGMVAQVEIPGRPGQNARRQNGRGHQCLSARATSGSWP